MGLRLVLLHLQAWRHRASTRGLASLLPAAKATRAPRGHCWAPSSMPGPPSSAHFIRLPLLNARTPVFRSFHPSAPLPPELSAHARCLHLCSAPGTLHLDQASLLSKVLLSESSRYTGHRPCTWSTFNRASRPQSRAHWGGDEADGSGGGGPIESRSLTAPLPRPRRHPRLLLQRASGQRGWGDAFLSSLHAASWQIANLVPP